MADSSEVSMRLDFKLMRYSAAMSSAVLTMGIVVFGGFWCGSWLDRHFSLTPLFTISGLLVGICAGLAWVLYVARKSSDQ
jgi:F0F1-type ATP synthase assembly protein I